MGSEESTIKYNRVNQVDVSWFHASDSDHVDPLMVLQAEGLNWTPAATSPYHIGGVLGVEHPWVYTNNIGLGRHSDKPPTNPYLPRELTFFRSTRIHSTKICYHFCVLFPFVEIVPRVSCWYNRLIFTQMSRWGIMFQKTLKPLQKTPTFTDFPGSIKNAYDV